MAAKRSFSSAEMSPELVLWDEHFVVSLVRKEFDEVGGAKVGEVGDVTLGGESGDRILALEGDSSFHGMK